MFEDSTSPELEKTLSTGSVTLYAGFDPTSDSLQVGNLVTIMTLAHFQLAGHRPIALAGGATGMIGDPSGKSAERNLLTHEQAETNLVGIKENLSRFLDFKHPTAPAMIVNNNDWFKNYTFIEFLRDIGKHFRMGIMLNKESVKKRLDSETGMSFCEFSYQLLQAYDFLKLYDTEKCVLQIGGSDQWGNITAGTDLVRRLRGVEAYGMTHPLVCDSTGAKFGKSAGNAVYLDSRKTSCYAFYQFFMRAEDADAVKLLKIYTFLGLDEINALAESIKTAPEKREAQRRLAEEVTRLVHGETGLKSAQKASEVLFGGSVEGLKASEIRDIFADVPSASLEKSKVEGSAVIDLAAVSGLCKSKGDARRLVESGGLYVNNRKVDGIQAKVAQADIIEGSVVILRSGKKSYMIVKVV